MFMLIDGRAFDNKIFNDVSLYFNSIMNNYFGDFSFLILSLGLFIGLIMIFPAKINTKLFVITGYILVVFFIPPFFETFKPVNLNVGSLGINLSKPFKHLSFGGSFFLYFFWFFLSIFLLIFPFRTSVVTNIIKFLASFKKSHMPSEKKYVKNNPKHIQKKRNVQKKMDFPWLSKIVFESTDSRIEIPIIPKADDKIKKFKLLNNDANQEEYEEIIPLPKKATSPINKKPEKNKNEYYEQLKETWPEQWQKDYNNQYEEDVYTTEELQPIDDSEIIEDVYNDINLPLSDILENGKSINSSLFRSEQKESTMILEQTLLEFGIKAEVTEIIHGPVVTLYKLIPARGIKLQKIEGLSNNLALRLAAKSIRIIAPIPGEKVVGIEIPNRIRELVKFKEIVNNETFNESKYNIPIGLGKDIYGNIIVIDLFKMPHILIAGATGAGKSVCVNAIISSILFSKTPEDVRLMLIDPKIVELKPYNNIPHLLTPVIIDPKKAMHALKYLLFEMERRYSLLDQMGARDIVEYKKRKSKKKYSTLEDLPFIVTIIDEFADLMSTSGKEAEILFARLAAKARAVGIHLVLATQRPSTDVITGLIKANIPSRIAFQVISLLDSRIILDQKGAEKLLGQGDMLYLSPSQPFPIRLQGAFLSKDEVDLIAEHWKSIAIPDYINIEEILEIVEEEKEYENTENIDPLFEQALEIVYSTQKASASYLQRRLNIGYNRAARIVEEMEKMGIVGPQRGAKPREIISSMPDYKT